MEAADARYENLQREHDAEMKTATETVMSGKLEQKNDNDAKVRRGVYLRYKGKVQKLCKKQSATIGWAEANIHPIQFKCGSS